jgi:hypothetical protein
LVAPIYLNQYFGVVRAQDKVGRPTDVGIIGDIDPLFQIAALHFYDGLLKLLPLAPFTDEAFNVRLEELQVLDIKFLHGYQEPTLCILYQVQPCCMLPLCCCVSGCSCVLLCCYTDVHLCCCAVLCCFAVPLCAGCA